VAPAASPLARLNAKLAIHVVPRAAQSAVAGRHGDAIKIRIAAPPVEGAANAELIRFLAETLGVPRRGISITAGTTGRRKIVSVDGIDMTTALRILETT
jgi:uncharacterized protein (TIGR00251 family)